jgi:hypothetical protein
MEGDPGGEVSSSPQGMQGAKEPPGEKVPAGHLQHHQHTTPNFEAHNSLKMLQGTVPMLR